MNTETQLTQIKEALGLVIKGKETVFDQVLIGILSGGHILLEDVPGVGKTTLAKALALVLGLQYARVQFTPDLLPADILGLNMLDPRDGTFTFHPGPIFHHLVLADEINRASPRTQSALLEAMNETQVTIDGHTRVLPNPFFVVATQNPVDYQGTYPLPEAQLDRFLLKISMGYPDFESELKVLFDRQLENPITHVRNVIDAEILSQMQAKVKEVTVEKDVAKYILLIVEATRKHADLKLGASPRASLALFHAAQARAFLQGRDWVGPADIQTLAEPVLEHRLMLANHARYGGKTTQKIVSEIIQDQEIPK